jgi:methionine-rich copper-binding protein CopC
MNRSIVLGMVAAVALFGTTTSGALAHAGLVHCSITNNQVFRYGHTPSKITAFFAEELNPAPSKTWMAVFEGQADHGLVTENQHSTVPYRNPREMTLPLPRKLGREKYYLIWYTRSAIDDHTAAGIVYFRVK